METDIQRPLVEALIRFGVDPAFAESFAKGLTRRSYQAKENVFVEDDPNPSVVYILSGYMRMYVTDQDGEISTRLLAGPGHFIGCIVSTLYDSPAQYTAECISDCQVVVVNKNTIIKAKKSAESRAILQDIVLHHLVNLMQEKAIMLPLKATDRYLYFKKRYPRMMERIPAGILANYIGVRPQSLSRIKQMLK
ncbi:CRP-like cAMP-binding protein [Neolewinella xylanilytica]|uniref:CRP-like cAMP-binding protein n=1 Tax=Neolewinella xylanilytica TaxID=1514080 RepID=A0A2S6I298_9BACT|nr:Crp/Fnr family transcriptional regulator [Neolewinella xylanilytica]PPK85288.1 CRP-like cAMP-binding protein [Neolewinella xylanilytica]